MVITGRCRGGARISATGLHSEVNEELGLDIVPAHLLCVDYKVQQGMREEGIQFVFFGGILPVGIIEQIQLQAAELYEVRFVQLENALVLLNLWSARRLPFTMKALEQGTTVYLEDGQPVE